MRELWNREASWLESLRRGDCGIVVVVNCDVLGADREKGKEMRPFARTRAYAVSVTQAANRSGSWKTIVAPRVAR